MEMQRRCCGDTVRRCGEASYYLLAVRVPWRVLPYDLLPYYSPHSIPTYWRVLLTMASTTYYGEYLGGRFLRRFLEEEAEG